MTYGSKTFTAIGVTPDDAAAKVDALMNAWLSDHQWVAPDGRSAYVMSTTIGILPLNGSYNGVVIVITLTGPMEAR